MTIQEKIIKAIKKYQTIIIHRHQRPDPDAIGSQMGLAEIIRSTFPEKDVYSVGKQYPGFNWLGDADVIRDQDYNNALVIVIDTANQPRIDDSRYNQGDMLIKIDHHPNDDQFGDLMLVNNDASSASEIVYDLYASANELQIDAEAGRLLYAGIVGDTGRFKYPSTTAHTFQVVSKLAELDFSTSKVNQIEDEIDVPLAHLSAYLYQNLHILNSGAAYIILNNEILNSFDLGNDSTSAIVPLPGRIHSVRSWAIFVQQKDGTYRIRLRSNGPAINELAKEFGGGGHPLASGAVANNSKEIQNVINLLSKRTAEYGDDKK